MEINKENKYKYYCDMIVLLENKNKEFNENCEIRLAVMKSKLILFKMDINESNELYKEKLEQYQNELNK